LDSDGKNKFIRLPALSGSKKPNSKEICNMCACMNRFATSPGAGANTYTPPGQNQCVYNDSFEYYYYPIYIENINKKLTGVPPTIIGKYTVVSTNIIELYSEEDLGPINLYNTLTTRGGISHTLDTNFITNILYKNNSPLLKELQLYLLNEKK
jgi:hypothetical protein